MKTNFFLAICLMVVFVGLIPAQKADRTETPPRRVIFAVMNAGRSAEPIAYLDGKKLAPTESVGDEKLGQFGKVYYPSKLTYTLIFGGAADGTISIGSSNIGKECGSNTADVLSKPVSAMLSDMVMALATNVTVVSRPGLRRRPTDAERTAIEAEVRKRFIREGARAADLKTLRYFNLTALDIDHDGTPEFVGSYWVAPRPDRRLLLFFVADQDSAGKYDFVYSDHSVVFAKDLMSGDLKDVEGGLGAELLVDVLDFDNDRIDEIFTVRRAFEGNNFAVYKRSAGKWSRDFESYNYHCAY